MPYTDMELVAKALKDFCRSRSSALDGCNGCPFNMVVGWNRWGCVIRCPEEWPLELVGKETDSDASR